MRYVSTGVLELDLSIGGFSPGSLVSVTGPPGVGKTIFAANWLHDGAKRFGEKGIYVSFAESYGSFLSNMRSLGFNFKSLEKKGKFRFLEIPTLKEEGTSAIIKQIVEEVSSFKVTRLVIDPFSALSQMIRDPLEIRVLVHTVLGKVVRQLRCTTMVIVEKPEIGEYYEPVEFLSDYILNLRKSEINGAPLRYLRIVKARGSEITRLELPFTLKGGFKVFKHVNAMMFGLTKKFRVIPHGDNYFSTGIYDLDKILGSRIQGGTYNLLEIEKDVSFQPSFLFCVLAQNFLNQNGCVVILPPQSTSALMVKKFLEPLVQEEFLERNLRVVEYRAIGGVEEEHDRYRIFLNGKSISEDMWILWNVISELREKSKRPVFSIVGFDTLEYMYGEKEILKILGVDVAFIRNFNHVRLNIIRPNVTVADHLRALADMHLIAREIHGSLFIQGVKPKTPLLNVELSTEGEFAEVKLTPVL
ncbi:hypothetical protein J7L29_03755 [Candidatus Bathyarchaeota archaeon]|nr:hypothetical protein [Candidatus Bathyarchaeota archaeon]